MTPQEIAQLKQQSPALQQALKEHRSEVWPFLRDQVKTRYRYVAERFHTCECCDKNTNLTLKSPYNDWFPGWCIECVLHGFLTPDIKTLEEIEEEKWQIEQGSWCWEPPEGVWWS